LLRRWRQIDRYLGLYKLVYLIGLTTNLAILAAYEHLSAPVDLAIGAAALIANAAAWMLFLSGSYIGFIAERVLSAGRMIVPIAAATILLSYPVMTLSPLSVVLWIGVLRLWIARGNAMLWILCASLLVLEITYFRRLRSHPIR
jgi:hypothetical protein